MQIARRIAAIALLGLAIGAPSASATFHEMSIREVYPGSIAQPDAEYVELQMWSPGQNLVSGHSLKAYSASGAPAGTTTFARDVSSGANQSTILLATPAAEAAFGVTPDTGMASGQLDPAGGAVCWTESIDCVSWGSFGGSLPSPAGTPAAAIPDGMALRRTIAPGCATLLEPADDRDNSAADFSVVFPFPRPEFCRPQRARLRRRGGQSGAGGGSGQGGRGAPRTTLRSKPAHKTGDRTPTFRFSSNEPGASFECKLDQRPFRPCRSPYTSKKLALGPHTFKVRARDESGKRDPSPASYSFRIVAKR